MSTHINIITQLLKKGNQSMLNFSIFLESESSPKNVDYFNAHRVVLAPGRYNPPHLGHIQLVEQLVALSEQMNASPLIVMLTSKNNIGLTTEMKKNYLNRMFPHIPVRVFGNVHEAIVQLKGDGVLPVGGIDSSFCLYGAENTIKRVYNGMVGYNTIVLENHPEAASSLGITNAKVVQAVMDGNFAKFRTFFPEQDRQIILGLFETIRNSTVER